MLLMAQAPRSAQRTSGEEAVLEDVHDYYALCCKVVSAQTNIFTDIALFGFPGGSDGKASACNVGDPGSIPGSGRSPGEGNGNPLQDSCLGNPMDRGAWWTTVHGVEKSQT